MRQFFSIWVSPDITGPPAVKRAMDLIDFFVMGTHRRR